MHTHSAPTVPRAGESTAKVDLLASLVVFMVALPLCIAIARACGLPPETGIITGIVGGLVAGALRLPTPGEWPGGRPHRPGA
jgi:MFS superfamily sulfate permease-like transporter